MTFKYTPNQQKIVNHRTGNLLVSAGAGSGKTSVLTAHIIERLNDKNDPIDIDRFLVVTFTKAAAAEMKERISKGVNNIRQKTLLSNAHISTIDSFCSWIVKNNFEKINLDPNYKLASEGELTLIKHEIFDEMMEQRYLKMDPSFIDFVDSYTDGKDDDNIFIIINNLYEKGMSQANPDSFFNKLKSLSIGSDIYSLCAYKTYSDNLINELKDRLKNFEDIEIYSHDAYEDVYPLNLDVINTLRACNNIKDLADYFIPTVGKSIFKTKKKLTTTNDDAYKIRIDLYNDYLKSVRNLVKNYYDINEAYIKTVPYLEIVFDLLFEFYEKYQAEKADRSIADFADVEHYALQILSSSPEIAANIRDGFDEILIDEYQDSNDLQEAIFNKITTGNNLFMVGDIKQSIYGFRNATPSIFLNKYKDYKNHTNGEAIDLSENFRCREEVVDSVNEIFEAIMTEDMGGSDYKNTSKLLRYAAYCDPASEDLYKTELAIIKSDLGSNFRLKAEGDYICKRIKELIDNKTPIFDKELGIERPIMFKDIAVISRNIKAPSKVFSPIFNEHDIPLITARSTGYFDSSEIKIILNTLSVIDNPRQDIPLASVMLSPIGGFSNDELALIRDSYKPAKKIGNYNDFYDAVIIFNDSKTSEFVNKLNRYRSFSKSHNILEVINLILKETGYEFYLMALKDGDNRLANIEMLKEYAKDYENTSYSGIYDFCKYISNIKKKDVDFTEANILSNNDNVVKLMSVHSSKGLEFPVVFLANLSAGFSSDKKSNIYVNADFGVSLNYKNFSESKKSKNKHKEIICSFNDNKLVSEEMRLLYVGMTRAREKLILVSSENEDVKHECIIDDYSNGIIPPYIVGGAKSFYDFILMAKRKIGFKYISVSEVKPTSEIKTMYKMNYEKSNDFESFKNDLKNSTDKIDFKFNYFNEAAAKVKGSYSISELNAKSLDATSDPKEQLRRSRVYSFEPGGAEVGTAYHAIFELIKPSDSLNVDDVNLVINELVVKNKFTKEIADKINPSKIVKFYNSDIGKKVINANKEGKMFREKAFVLGVPACELYSDCQDSELTIIQGVIDMFFEDSEGITLIDYKSNAIKDGEEDKLIEKYKEQIRYYTRALEAETGKKVNKKYLYSIALDKFIEVS